jgi:vacuolar-type H+-ATPase subunit F/Vma7
MINKKEIFVLASFFLLGVGGAWQYVSHLRAINNTPEKIAQRIVNSAIQEDICERVQDDLKRFKESPSSFQRTSLNIVQRESKQTLRKLLISQGVPEDFPLEFSGKGSEFDECLKDVKAWLNVPSIGSQNIESEFAQVGTNQKADSKSQSDSVKITSETKRVALVIGNSEYKNRPLKNPKADAEDMRDFLKDANFDVIFINDASLSDLRNGFDNYFEKIKKADVGFIYYSGHGIEHKGRNYLLPINFNVVDEDEIPRQSLDISSIVEKINKFERKVNVVIIDACRSSFVPAKQRSLTQGLQKMDGARGTILAFSTAPGKVAEDGNGRNSPYTKHLLKSMSVPGRKIEDVFKETARNVELETVGRQIPWYNSSLLVDFALK